MSAACLCHSVCAGFAYARALSCVSVHAMRTPLANGARRYDPLDEENVVFDRDHLDFCAATHLIEKDLHSIITNVFQSMSNTENAFQVYL